MKVLSIVHGYPPLHNAGAEWMLHEMLKDLLSKGHTINVVVPGIVDYDFEGVQVLRDEWTRTKQLINDCDLIVSHLKQAGRSLNACEFYKKPFIQIIHNTNYYGILAAKHNEITPWISVVYNSFYTKSEMNYPNPSLVVHPPVDQKRYKTKPGTKITLINLFERKGGKFFNELAKLMPDYEFLGVEGDYGKQEKTDLPNMTYMANTPDAKKIYSKTRILLIPSEYESYGRVGIEAMCSGIPVIAAPTPGLKESLGSAGIFCKLSSPLSWIEAIKRLDDPKEYASQSKKCLARVKEVESGIRKELESMEQFFNKIIEKRTA
jgi:glycosyltransferase involved in cell wall biosynthesis